MTNLKFTRSQILNAIKNWKHEPFTPKELTFLNKSFTKESYTYGENDIESLILETLSELDNQ